MVTLQKFDTEELILADLFFVIVIFNIGLTSVKLLYLKIEVNFIFIARPRLQIYLVLLLLVKFELLNIFSNDKF